MKQIVFFLYLLSSLIFFGQTKEKLSIKKNTKGDQPFYRTKTSDVFYIGVENKFILYKDPSKKYSVTMKNGSIRETNENSKDSAVYMVKINNTEPSFVTITVDSKTFSYKFRAKRIPSPEIKILLGTEFSKDEEIPEDKFKKAISLVLELNNFDFDVGMKIIGMQLTVVKNGEKKNYLLTDQRIEEHTKNAVSGDIYIFSQIVIEFTNSKDQRTINGKTYFIK